MRIRIRNTALNKSYKKNSVCKSFLNVKTLPTLGHLRYKNRARMRKNVDSTEFCNEADLTGPKSAAHKY